MIFVFRSISMDDSGWVWRAQLITVEVDGERLKNQSEEV